MHLDGKIDRTQRYTWKSWMSLLGDRLRSHDRARFEEYLEAVDVQVIVVKAVNVKAVNLEAVNLEAVDREACVMDANNLRIS
jgi:hypothetical protein